MEDPTKKGRLAAWLDENFEYFWLLCGGLVIAALLALALLVARVL
jgi:hypothetical protein